MMVEPRYDHTHWPILIVSMPPLLGGRDLDRHLNRIAAYLERATAQTHVVDLRRCEGFTVDDRARIAEFGRGHAHLATKWLRGKAYVADSWRQREMIGALMWQLDAPYEVKVFSEMRWARAWASRIEGETLCA
jgi:hypothetical protein